MSTELNQSTILAWPDTALVISIPPTSHQAMLKMPAMFLGMKGASNQHCIADGGEMGEFAGLKTFGQDCSLKAYHSSKLKQIIQINET